MRVATLADLTARRPRRRARVTDGPREEDLQPELLAHIASTYPTVDAYATLNGIRLTPHLRKHAKRQGMRRGISDIYVVWPGGDGWLEVKLPGYSPSDVQVEQSLFIGLQRANGRNAAIVTSTADIDSLFADWGVPRGAA